MASRVTGECLESVSADFGNTARILPGKRVCAEEAPHALPQFSKAAHTRRVLPQAWLRHGIVRKIADQTGLGIIKPSDIYQIAYQDYLQGRYQLAIDQFGKFVEDFPTSSLAPQAYYYLGECYQNLGNLTRAAENFSLIITRHKEKLANYQNSRQVPPALFRLGGVYEEAGKLDKAKAFWGILLTDFPGTPEAQLAKRRLQQLP